MELTKIVETYSCDTEEIINQIDKMTKGNCITVFTDYIDKALRGAATSTSKFEKGYLSKLDYNISKLARLVISEEVANLSKEQLFEKVISLQVEGTYSFDSMYENHDLYDFLISSTISSEKMLSIIKEYMRDVLNEFKDEFDMTAKEKKLKDLKEKKEDYLRMIKYNSEKLKEIETALGKF